MTLHLMFFLLHKGLIEDITFNFYTCNVHVVVFD